MTRRRSLRSTATAAAAAALLALLPACGAPQEARDSQTRGRVELGSKLLDVADVAHTVFQNEVIAAYVSGQPRELVALREQFRNGATSNIRSLALGADPYGALVDLYVWVRLADIACTNRNRLRPDLHCDCESTYGEVRHRLDTIIARGKLISDEQRAQLDGVIARYMESHPDILQAGLFRIEDLEDFSGSRMAVIERAPRDMLSPVEDAVAQLEQARLVGRQMVWLASRLPTQAGWEAQALADSVLANPEFLRLAGNLGAISERMQNTGNRLESVGAEVRALSESVQGLGKEVSTLSAAREIVRYVLMGAVLLLVLGVGAGVVAVRHVTGRIERAMRDRGG
jgi:hypothetical protein